MNLKFVKFMLLALFGLFGNGCHSQTPSQKPDPDDRKPAVAGQFYSADEKELKKNLQELFQKAKPREIDNPVLAVIVPHAGYVFSGIVAASGFNQIDPQAQFKRIFIIGSSHRVAFEGASVYAKGGFITPLGRVPVDTDVAGELLAKSKYFQFYKDAHWYEHSLEVEIPFLQYHLKNPFTIVPIVLGTQSQKTVEEIAKVLKPYLNPENLFVISTDFSHYPSYKDACVIDKTMAEAVLKNDPSALMNAIKENENRKIRDLATSMCGWTSVLTLLHMTAGNGTLRYKDIHYMNSGDSPYGDSSRVVGYYAIAVYSTEKIAKKEFELTLKDKKDLLAVARNTLVTYITDNRKPVIDASGFSDNLKKNCGAFVTLHKDGRLRGCIGRFNADIPLYEVVREMTIAAATEDYRFSPVTKDELSKIEIEISVLSPMKKITSIDEIEMGKHGIYISKGGRSGTFLPQVAKETGWTKEEFLGHCAQDKAGIGWNGWKDADIYIYTALVFSESEVK